jgi:hypothetical protein
LLAVVFFPSCWLLAPDSNGVAVSAGYIAIAASLAPLGFMVYQRRLPVLFNGLFAINLAPIWFLFLESILPGYDAYEHIAPVYRLEAFAWTAAFLFMVNATYLILKQPLTKSAIHRLGFVRHLRPSANFYFYVTLFTFTVPLLAFLVYYGSPNILWTAIAGGRSGGGSAGGLLIQNSVGDASSLMLPINFIWQITPCFGLLTFLRSGEGWDAKSLIALLLGFLVIFAFFLSGSRGNMMYVAAPYLFGLFYYNWNRGLKFWVFAGMLFLGLVGVMELQVRFRGNLLEVIADPEGAARRAGLESATTIDVTESQRDNNMYLLCMILKGFPDKYEFEGFHNFFTIIANPIPRAIWPSKPILVGSKDLSFQPRWVLDGPLFMGTTSLSYSVIGEAYKNKGLFALFIYAVIYAVFLLYFDALSYFTSENESLVVAISSLSIFLGFWGFRSFFAFITFLYPLLILIALLWGMALWDGRRTSLNR